MTSGSGSGRRYSPNQPGIAQKSRGEKKKFSQETYYDRGWKIAVTSAQSINWFKSLRSNLWFPDFTLFEDA